ncbi:MAG: hypothetical protein MI784_00925 [Cytophagales bacterium]|nr:hypothetical protein [Cytophagales bacterium]
MLLHKGVPYSYLMSTVRIEVFCILLFMMLFGLSRPLLLQDQISVPLAIPAILGTAISLILGFRTAQAYGRWWEARMVWGAIVNDSRSLIRQLITFANGHQQNEVNHIANLQIAWVHLLGQTLRKNIEEKFWKGYLTKEEYEYVSSHSNKPNAILLLIAKKLKTMEEEKELIRVYETVQIDTTLNRLCDSMGRCERIKNTVFPATYCMMVHLFVYAFVFVLPFGLIGSLGWEIYPLVISIGTIFFLIEKIGVFLQDPFENRSTDTPVSSLARTIEINLLQMTNQKRELEPIQEHSYFVM